MEVSVKGTRSAGFILALMCFSMPLVTMSCPGGSYSFTGAEMVFGTMVNEPQPFGPPKQRRLSPEPLAAAAAGSALVGAMTAVASSNRIISAALAVTGGGSLLLLKNKIDTQVQTQALGLVKVSYEVGYWVALAAYGLAFALNVFIRSTVHVKADRGSDVDVGPHHSTGSGLPVTGRMNEVSAVPSITTSAVTASQTSVRQYCGSCGMKVGTEAKFCPQCGIRM